MHNFWEISGWEREDRHLRALSQGPFQRDFPQLPLGPGLFVIRGPRQIGKSSWLKTLLAKSDPRNSFYLSCENIGDYRDLAEILKANRDRKILYFDEITFVEEWWRAIKHALDQDDQLRIVLTGSHAFDVRKGMDQMPGRWGNGGEFELLPMDFDEFVAMRNRAGWAPHLSRQEELSLYFKCGGFPISVIESGAEGLVPKKSMEIYRHWLLGDLLKIGKQEIYLKEILLQIALTTTSTLSLQKLAQRTQIGSHNTAQDYVELLESCFALKTLYAVDIDTGSPRFRKEKKFYFRDPLIYWLALDWAGVSPPGNAMEQVAEIVAHEHLLRRYKRFGYLATNKGEIDFFSAGNWALEVKWTNVVPNLSRLYKDIHLPHKILWTVSNFLKEWPPKP
jgi:predicted AAA+ superfamily ATPase